MQTIVLSRRDFRESDQIISFYTQEHGKREALARGVKKITSKNSGSLEPFSVVEAEIIPGKDIDHIGSVQIIELFKNIRGDLAKITTAQSATALIEQLFSSGEPDAMNFNLIVSWFQSLNRASNASPIVLDALILKLLARLGFAPELEKCVHCDKHPSPRGRGTDLSAVARPGRAKVEGEGSFSFDIPAGGLVCAACSQKQAPAQNTFPLSPAALTSLRTIFEADWKPIFELKLDKKELIELHRLVYRFGVFHSGKELVEWSISGIDVRI